MLSFIVLLVAAACTPAVSIDLPTAFPIGPFNPGTTKSNSLPSNFTWSSSPALISAKSDGQNILGIKDPSIVEVEGTYHVFATTATASGYNLAYLSFTNFSQAQSATFHNLSSTLISSGYRAPQVFYFGPHSLWYLFFQNGFSAYYSTNFDISNPSGWSAPRYFFLSEFSITSWSIDSRLWNICDSANCYLFSSDDSGHLYRASTTLADFPSGFGNAVIAKSSDSGVDSLFGASCVYNVGNGVYLLLVEAIGSDGYRYFRSWTSTNLTGTWTALADTEANPFAGASNVVFNGTAWTKSISYGEMVRTNPYQTLTISPCNLTFLYQGVNPSSTASYDFLPWKLGLLTQTNSAC